MLITLVDSIWSQSSGDRGILGTSFWITGNVGTVIRSKDDDGVLIYAPFESFGDIQSYLETNNIEILSSGFERIPQVTKKLEGDAIADVEKLLEKLENANLDIDPSDERVLKEIAIYAEKSDVSEEITRLKSHLSQFSETCSSSGSVGRKLEFILQEISRELNTYCSKSARSQGTTVALDARVEVEKIREQVMNIE